MQSLIPPVSKQILEEQLSSDKLLRKTGRADNSIYVVTAADSPDVMREIGRLRELAFRQPVAERALRATSMRTTLPKTDTNS